ncbi:MAG: beta galactosidase jelly roll domain-containing protein [Actinomycetota bacterium]|nr:beta galactosidase jelly roll domain-containing protein [Actinomycetota bacterium]
MSLTRFAVLFTLLTLLGTAGPAAAQAASAPDEQALYNSGPNGRFLMDGEWLFRLDPGNVGLKQGFAKQTTRDGWSPTSVPNAWNATDESVESFMGNVGWYRKDFKLPSAKAALSWVTRFESVNYRSRVYLNGVLVGKNKGAYLPFELRMPPSVLKRGGTNRLVVRVENKRLATDFPPSGLSVAGKPTGGWWNYGGILREVYLRRVDRVDFSTVQVRPDLPCATCAASVNVRLTVRNFATDATRMRITGRFGNRRVNFGTVAVGAKRFATVTRRLRIGNPRLWSPERPNLYDVDLRATAVGAKRRLLQRYRLKTGIRSVKVVDGKWLLNGKKLNLRGVGLHEDDPKLGFAITNRIRAREVAETKELGATLMRSHYPLHPYTHELADQQGVMVWSEIPVYALKTEALAKLEVRKLAARELEKNILTNQNHPSIIVWSIGNELSARPGPVQSFYIARAVRSAKRLDPTRPVGYAVAGYPAAGCQAGYGPLDILGINEYFGWYPGPNGQIADRELLGQYLDSVHACYPKKAVLVTEFGAEANRNGPVEEKGTYEFQSDFVNYHLGVYATRPWLAGAIYWALEEFRVRPGWEGGNPRPMPPIHQKGLITFDGQRKPAFGEVQRLFKGVDQLEGG